MEKLSGIEWNTFPLSSVTAGSGTIYQLSYIFMASRNGTRFIDYFSCFQRGYFLFLPSFTFISFQYFPAPSPLTENTLLASSLKSHFLLCFQCFGLASFYSCSTEHKTEIGSERPPIYKALVLWGNSGKRTLPFLGLVGCPRPFSLKWNVIFHQSAGARVQRFRVSFGTYPSPEKGTFSKLFVFILYERKLVAKLSMSVICTT